MERFLDNLLIGQSQCSVMLGQTCIWVNSMSLWVKYSQLNRPTSPILTSSQKRKVLKALTYFQLCDYNKVEKIINDFDATYQPMRTEITEFLADYETVEQRKLADQAWNRYFGPEADGETVLPQAFFSRVLKNQDLAGVVRHLEMMDQEISRIDSEKPQWRDTVGVHLKKVIEKDKRTYEKRAGRLLIAEMQVQNEMLASLLSQSQIIGFEVVDAQRLDYEYKASNFEALTDQSKFDVDFATSLTSFTGTIQW